jgi:hypothetical protein
MLLDRFDIRFIDELADEVKRGGAPSLEENIDMILESIPKDLSQDGWEDASQRAMYAEILRYQKEVEEPAAAILRERKASQPSTVKKVEVALCGVENDAHFYRELLEGIEPELEVARGTRSELPDPSGVLGTWLPLPRLAVLRLHLQLSQEHHGPLRRPGPSLQQLAVVLPGVRFLGQLHLRHPTVAIPVC